MGEAGDCRSKISIWWDIENCGVPKDVDPHFIALNLSSALQHADLTGPIEINVFGDTTTLPRNTQKALCHTGITLNHVPRGNKEAADKQILVAMLLWALDNPPPAHLLLVSGDGDFANALHRLRLKRYSILLACPVIDLKPALLGSAKKVWYWKDLAKGQLAEWESSQPTETPDEYLVPQNGGSSISLRSSANVQQTLGSGSSNSSVRHTHPPGFSSPQMMGLGSKGKKMGDPATTAVSAILEGKYGTSLNFPQLENLCLQSEEKGYDAMGVNSDFSETVATPVLGSRSQPNALPHEGIREHDVEGTFNYGVSDPGVIQSSMDITSVKVQANYSANVRPSDPQGSSHAQNFIRPVRPPLTNTASKMGSGNTPFMPRAANYNDSRKNFMKNMPSGNAVNFTPPSPAVQDSYIPRGLMPRAPVKYAPPNFVGRPPLSNVSDPNTVIQQNHALASSSLSQSHSVTNSHYLFLDKVYSAMKTLEGDMLTPTESNLLDCIRYWDKKHDDFDLKNFLSKAVEEGQVTKIQLGQGFTMFFPPINKGPWDCVDPGNMQFDHSHDVWYELRQFLLYSEHKKSLENSQNGYEAAQILKKASSSYIRDLVIGRIMNVLQQAIQRKKWISKSGTGWSPLTINKMVLLDCLPNDTRGTDFRSSSLGHQEGVLKSFKCASATNVDSTLSVMSKDAILEKLKSWLPHFLKEDKQYEASKLINDFEQATGIHLDYRKLGFPSLRDLLKELADIAFVESTRSGQLMLCPAKKDAILATSVKENNTKSIKQIQVLKELQSWLIHVMAIAPNGYDISKIQQNFLESTGINLDKEGFDLNQLQGLLRQLPDIVQIVNTSVGVCLAYPAGQKPVATQLNRNFSSMGAATT